MIDGCPHASDDVGVGGLEGIEEFEKDRKPRETTCLDVSGEGAEVDAAAIVGPAPVRVALEVRVLEMQQPDVRRERCKPVLEGDLRP